MSKDTYRKLLAERGHSMATLAAAIGVNKSTVLRWLENRLPAERVLDVERITGISRHELRPDIYPLEAAS